MPLRARACLTRSPSDFRVAGAVTMPRLRVEFGSRKIGGRTFFICLGSITQGRVGPPVGAGWSGRIPALSSATRRCAVAAPAYCVDKAILFPSHGTPRSRTRRGTCLPARFEEGSEGALPICRIMHLEHCSRMPTKWQATRSAMLLPVNIAFLAPFDDRNRYAIY